MVRTTRKRRGIARCANCGTITVVYVWPDGSVDPIGTEEGGKCGDADLQVIDAPTGTDGSSADGADAGAT